MKIGIITQPLRYNYGGILQNYALQVVLKKYDHDVVTLDGNVKYKKTLKNCIIKPLKDLIHSNIDNDGKLFHLFRLTTTEQILSQNTRKFINKYIKVRKLHHLSPKDFDALIVGSDQVWRPQYSKLDDSFLKFAFKWKNIKRIAYAASFGSEEWEYTDKETQFCRLLIKKFDAVSVREDSGIYLCRNYFNINATHVLDPTLLLTKEEYINNLGIKNIEQSDGDLFYYFLDDTVEKRGFVNAVGKEKHLRPFTVNSKVEDPNATINNQIQPPIEKWLRAFYDANIIITDSFHGCVFSIIFNKPFLVIANNKRGIARFNSILKICNQQNRLIKHFNDVNTDFHITLLDRRPDVDLRPLRLKSLSFLKNHLM